MFHISYILANIGNIGFLFAFDREALILSLVCVMFTTGFGYVALTKSFINVYNNKERMAKGERIASYVLIQNGLDVYFTWTTVATCISISICLQYCPGSALYMNQTGAGTVGISILLIINVVFYSLDVTLFFDRCKYLYMGYLTLLWALGGVLVEHYDINNQNTIIIIVAIVLTALTLFIKIARTIYEHCKGVKVFQLEKIELA